MGKILGFFLGGLAMAQTGFKIESSAFKNQADIPAQYTCEAANISPALSWSGIPAAAKSLALIVSDPDAPDPAKPQMTFTHWVLYNIPPNTMSLNEGEKSFPKGTQRGRNDYRKTEYAGPCPPIGKHRYFFKLYALDMAFHFTAPPSRQDLESAMRKHILAETELVGVYQKKAP